MYFDLSINIKRPPLDVFAFLRDKDKYPQKTGSPVLVLEKTTPGPAGVGTRYREVIQMMPFVRMEILSEVTRFERGERLEEIFDEAGMKGYLAYRFVPEDGGTKLIQQEILNMKGFLKAVTPFVKLTLSRQLRKRLEAIKAVMEGGWVVNSQS
jgi:uncharacterized protein YndB with AHSA1/START domain